MANRTRSARGRLPRMNTTQTTPKLTTSAMIASFADPGQKTASAPFGHALARLADERPEIVGPSADLAKYTDMHIFRDAHPDRFFHSGMAGEAPIPRRRRPPARGGIGAVRVHVRGLRHPTRVRLPMSRHRRAGAQCQCRRRAA